MSYGSGSTPRVPISGANDTVFSGLAPNHYLVFDSPSQKWINRALTVADFSNLQAVIDARIQAVTGYAASNGNNVSASVSNGTNQATLSWSTSSTISGLTGWRVGRDGTDTNGSGAWSTTDPASATSRIFTQLTSGATYTLSVAPVVNGTVGTAVTVTAHPN